MTERKDEQPILPFQIQTGLPIQFDIPAGASITITLPGEPRKHTVISRRDPIDVKKRYPKESSINANVVEEYIQNLMVYGSEHSDTVIAHEKLSAEIKLAVDRGFEDGRVLEDIEDIITETRGKYEGRKIGSEPMKIKAIRDQIGIEVLEMYSISQGHEEPA